MNVYKLTDKNHRTRNGLLNPPIHANFPNPVLWEAEASGEMKHDRGLKSGSTKLKTIRQIPLPEFTTERRVSFGIRCALEVYQDESFVKWANAWLSGEDRTESAARAVERAAKCGKYGKCGKCVMGGGD